MSAFTLFRVGSNLRPRIMKKTVMSPVLSLAAMIWTAKIPVQSVYATSPAEQSGRYCSSYSSCSDSGRSSYFSKEGHKQQESSFPKSNLPTGSAEDNTPYTDTDLQEKLSPLQYQVTQEAGTERAFTGKYYNHKEPGIYTCIVCGTPLFSSETKYDSGSGWPSFFAPFSSSPADGSSDSVSGAGRDHITTVRDTSHGMVREEARCNKCGSHLGHVFDDGPQPTGRRYCINSASLDFKPQDTYSHATTMSAEAGDIEADVTKCSLVFVYGTLKRGEPNHHWLTEVDRGSGRLFSPAITKEKFPLVIASRYNIPYLLHAPGQGKNVKGELYEVDGKMLANLDVLEAHPKYYRREIRKFRPISDSSDATTPPTGGAEAREAWVYLLHTFKPAMLELPALTSYESEGDHGLKYVSRYLRKDPGPEYWTDVKQE